MSSSRDGSSRDGLDPVRVHDLVLHQPALEFQCLVLLGERGERLGRGHRIFASEHERGRAGEVVGHARQREFTHRDLGERVLVDGEFGAGIA